MFGDVLKIAHELVGQEPKEEYIGFFLANAHELGDASYTTIGSAAAQAWALEWRLGRAQCGDAIQ